MGGMMGGGPRKQEKIEDDSTISIAAITHAKRASIKMKRKRPSVRKFKTLETRFMPTLERAVKEDVDEEEGRKVDVDEEE